MNESGENYLETILILQTEGDKCVHAVDVASRLGFSRASVSRALRILRDRGLLSAGKNGELTLTEAGLEKAHAIYERHKYIADFLIKTLGVDEQTANTDACRIEHVISEITFSKIRAIYASDNPS